MLRRLPEILGLGCYLVTDDRTRRKLDPTNHYRFEDGSPAKLDGTMGQYMWCWNAFYFATWKEGNISYYAISLSEIKGKTNHRIPAGGTSALGNGVMDRTGNLLCSLISDDVRYRGGNNNAALDGTPQTQLGMVATVINATTFSARARARGEGWDANWYVAQSVTELLFMIIFGTRNSQEAVNPAKDANGLYQGGLGNGVTTVNGTDWTNFNNKYPLVPTSVGVELGDGCGEVAYNIPNADGGVLAAVKVPVFFGLKHLFGHVWKFTRGTIDNVGETLSEIYVAPSLYNNYTDTSINGLIKVAEIPRAGGWIKQKSYYLLNGYPTTTGATNSTWYCDYFWENSATSKGLRVRLCGANAVYTTNAGAFASHSNIAASITGTYFSAPLCFFDEDPVMTP
jgi:hypothetical protein